MKFQYYPWSDVVLDEAIFLDRNGFLPTLDLELTAKCSGALCIYCDSKPSVCAQGMKHELSFNDLKEMLLEAKKWNLKWVYTCGLGEPLEDKNFWNLIELLKDNDICLSMFTNGVFIDDIYKARQLKKCGVNIILKMDTFKEKNFDVILGRSGVANKIYQARDYLIEAGYGARNSFTDLAFSIVPTSLSYDGIPEVIQFAKKHGIFASVGELEQAGEVINNRLSHSLGLKKDQIVYLKKIADEYAEGDYMRPICPCIITGLHIDNLGNCIVDRETGLNCKWFLLKEPDISIIGNLKEFTVYQLFEKAKEYRKRCINNPIFDEFDISYIFGGCGGNPKEIISLAKQLF